MHGTHRELISSKCSGEEGHGQEILSGSRGLVLISSNGGGEARRMTRGSRGYKKNEVEEEKEEEEEAGDSRPRSVTLKAVLRCKRRCGGRTARREGRRAGQKSETDRSTEAERYKGLGGGRGEGPEGRTLVFVLSYTRPRRGYQTTP